MKDPDIQELYDRTEMLLKGLERTVDLLEIHTACLKGLLKATASLLPIEERTKLAELGRVEFEKFKES